MAFLNGVMVLNAPASALNNAPASGEREENMVPVKSIKTKMGQFPYVSAQAFRYWLRTTLERNPDLGWKAAPVLREAKVAYTDANPIEFWDDDLFGYMRAASKKKTDEDGSTAKKRRGGAEQIEGTKTNAEITRVSPFKVSTLVSLAPTNIVEDFGVMARHDGDPVPHVHQFYHCLLKGLFSLDLHSAGTFTERAKTGFKNLDDIRVELAKSRGLQFLPDEKAYRLPADQRLERIAALLKGISILYGGAKQTLHYTDVTPSIFMGAVLKGGNNPFQYVFGPGPGDRTLLQINRMGLDELWATWKDIFISPMYVGWVQGFGDEERSKFETALAEIKKKDPEFNYIFEHPRRVIETIIQDMRSSKNSGWLE